MCTDCVSDKDKISYSQGHELLNVLIKAGLTSELAQEAINSPGNNLARVGIHAMFGEKVQTTSPAKQLHQKRSLEFVSKVIVAETFVDFVAKDKFIGDEESDEPIKIGNICFNFNKRFLDGKGKTEKPFRGSTLRCSKLWQLTPNAVVISELNGKVCAETSLTEMFAVMLHQGLGQSAGSLLLDWWNVFYIRDMRGELCAVGIRWSEKGWNITTNTTKAPGSWGADTQIFSRETLNSNWTKPVPRPSKRLLQYGR